MKFLGYILFNLSFLIIGITIKNGKNTNLIAGFNTNDKRLNKQLISKTVGNGLISIAILNGFIIALYSLLNHYMDLNRDSLVNTLQTIIIILISSIIVFKINKKPTTKS